MLLLNALGSALKRLHTVYTDTREYKPCLTPKNVPELLWDQFINEIRAINLPDTEKDSLAKTPLSILEQQTSPLLSFTQKFFNTPSDNMKLMKKIFGPEFIGKKMEYEKSACDELSRGYSK